MITILSEADIAQIALPDSAIRSAVEAGLIAQARGLALAEPTTVFKPMPGKDDLISVVRGALPQKRLALVKTVGGYSGNAKHGLETNPGCLVVIETETGQIVGLLPAASITTQRTAMVTAIGALRLARSGASVLGCIGTRGISVQAVRYIAHQMPLTEIRLHGRDVNHTKAAAAALTAELGVIVRATQDWKTCLTGADILIDGAALPRDSELFPLEALMPGSVLVAYGAFSALPLNVMDRVDRLVMDRWVADGHGALGPQTKAGHVHEAQVDALIGDVVTGCVSPRQSEEDRILFCHRGVAACDLVLAHVFLTEAVGKYLGTQVPF